jgi:hypothetical protein
MSRFLVAGLLGMTRVWGVETRDDAGIIFTLLAFSSFLRHNAEGEFTKHMSSRRNFVSTDFSRACAEVHNRFAANIKPTPQTSQDRNIGND